MNMQASDQPDGGQQGGHASKPSQVNGDFNSFAQPPGFHAARPSLGGLRDRQGAPMPAINTTRASAINPAELQTPGTGYNMNYTPLLPHDLLMGSPFQPGSPSTFTSPQFQSFPGFAAQPNGAAQGMHSLNGQMQAPQAMPGQMYQNIMSPTSPVGYGGMQQAAYTSMSPYGNQMPMGPAVMSGTSRTVYLGNIPPETSAEEILNHVRSGQIESVRLLPDKNCAFISFLDGSSAVHFHSDAILKKLSIKGQDIKIGWGKPSQVPSSVAMAVQQSGASRNVYLGNLPAEITEDEIREDLGKFGPIDTIKLVREKNIGFVHFLSVGNAIKTVTQLPTEQKWQPPRRVFYGKDRCAYVSKTQQQNAAQYLGIAPGYAHVLNSSDRHLISHALAEQSVQAAAVATAAGGVNNLGNRTVYLGNIHPETTTEEICNVVRGGLLHHIRYIPDKHICFVTFIDPTSAASFFALSNMQGLMIHNRRLKIGWGKHSGALPPAIALAVSGGASRNVYIGNIDESWSEEKLRQDFSEYGEIELVNALREKSCAFVNFTNIANAIKAIEAIKGKDEYKRFKINFGKDRCGNAPRQVHGQQQGFAQGGQSGGHEGVQSPPPGPGPSLQAGNHPGASVSPANSAMSSSHHSNGPNQLLSNGNSNPLTMYLSQISQQQPQQPSPQDYHQQQQISPSAYMNVNGNAHAHAQNGGYFHQPSQSVNLPSQPSHSTAGQSNGSGGLEPPGQPHYSSHAPSNSFSVQSGRGHASGPSIGSGNLQLPQASSSKSAHSRALSMPAFAFNPAQGNHSSFGSGLGGLSSGIGSLSNGISGYGLAIQGDGGLPRWNEEEIST